MLVLVVNDRCQSCAPFNLILWPLVIQIEAAHPSPFADLVTIPPPPVPHPTPIALQHYTPLGTIVTYILPFKNNKKYSFIIYNKSSTLVNKKKVFYSIKIMEVNREKTDDKYKRRPASKR